MRFIHSANICLDCCYAGQGLPPDVGRQNRLHLRTRLQTILDRAQTWPADAVLITGNLFGLEHIERDTTGFLREAFGKLAPIPVIICPGPLDPFVATSPYVTESWPENVHVYSTPGWSPFEVDGISIHGYCYDHDNISSDPMDCLDGIDSEKPHLLACWAPSDEQGFDPSDGEPKFSLERCGSPNLIGAALGWGSPTHAEQPPTGPSIWYAGAPEGTDFGQTGPFGYAEIEISPDFPAQRGPVARVNQVSLSEGRFFEESIDCTDLPSGQALIDAIRPHLFGRPDRQCVRIILEGALLPEIYDEMSSIHDALSEETIFLELVDRCFVAEDFAGLAKQKTSLGAFAARIGQEIDDAPDEVRRAALCRSRDLALCAYRGQHLPIRSDRGD
jgi:hypothetical protein